MTGTTTAVRPLPGVPPSLLGESPLWLPDEQALVWVDIPGRQLNEWRPADGRHRKGGVTNGMPPRTSCTPVTSSARRDAHGVGRAVRDTPVPLVTCP